MLVCETQPCPERLSLGQQLFCFLLCVNTFAALPTGLWGSPLDNKLKARSWAVWGDWWGMLCTHPGYVISNVKGSNCFHMLARWSSWCRASCLAVISSISQWWKIVPWKRGANFRLYSLKGCKLWTLLQDVIYGSSMFWLYIDEKTGLFCMHICIKIPSCSTAPSPPQRNPIKQ